MEIRQLIEGEISNWRMSAAIKLTCRRSIHVKGNYSFMLSRMKYWLDHYKDPDIVGYKKRICQMIGTISFNLSLNNEDTQTERS